ncbi:hypothetical protein [Acinetobacter baumannii]|uniref:hypothetical protein n=1 Tax=Acinetobacter baumannii TaxID=470 RepID=UPI00114F42DA|nr:hypothetical protein [Acinetobacter baumannii]MDP7921993.1 hypothetical protein [Acinetobacter baumannii]TQF19448.1 hypothetical protein FJU44_18670 [Acinetobacter baumannii]
MTDLNKEREAFLNTFQYYKGRRDIIFSHEHELFMTRSNNPSEIAQKEISNMNRRWDAWLRCAKHRDAELEKAKAQAVPDTHINISKDVAKRTIGHIATAMCHPNNTRSEEDVMVDDQEYICRAIKASESGAEG